jgi:hypothetical protein
MALNIEALDQELQAIEKRAQMIQDIKRLAADPEGKALLDRLMLNGSATLKPELPAPTADQLSDEYAQRSQIDSIRHAISKRSGQRFVVGDIGDELRRAGLDITNVAIGRALLRLTKAEEIRVALVGGGNIPNQYEVTEAFRAA